MDCSGTSALNPVSTHPREQGCTHCQYRGRLSLEFRLALVLLIPSRSKATLAPRGVTCLTYSVAMNRAEWDGMIPRSHRLRPPLPAARRFRCASTKTVLRVKNNEIRACWDADCTRLVRSLACCTTSTLSSSFLASADHHQSWLSLFIGADLYSDHLQSIRMYGFLLVQRRYCSTVFDLKQSDALTRYNAH